MARDREGELSSISVLAFRRLSFSFSLWRELGRGTGLPFAATLAGGVDRDFRELGVEASVVYGDAGIGGR